MAQFDRKMSFHSTTLRHACQSDKMESILKFKSQNVLFYKGQAVLNVVFC